MQTDRQTDTCTHRYRQGPEQLSNTCPLLFSACAHMLPVWISVSRTVATAHHLPSWFPVCYTRTSPPTPIMMSWLQTLCPAHSPTIIIAPLPACFTGLLQTEALFKNSCCALHLFFPLSSPWPRHSTQTWSISHFITLNNIQEMPSILLSSAGVALEKRSSFP